MPHKTDDKARIAARDPYVILALRLLQVTANDIRSANNDRRRFGRRFIRSDWFCVVCGCAGLDSDYVRDVMRGKRNGSRRQ